MNKKIEDGASKSKNRSVRLGGQGSVGTTGANSKGHALVDDIGNPSVSEQEDYGGAGDLGTTGAVGRNLSRTGKVGVTGIVKQRHPRVGPGDTGERASYSRRRPGRKKT